MSQLLGPRESADEAPAPGAAPSDAGATAIEPVRLGAEPVDDDDPIAEAVDWDALNRQTTTVAGRVREAVVYLLVTPGGTSRDAFDTEAGSGILLSPEGYVLTNAHVVARAGRIDVVLDDKRDYQAEVVGVDPTTDIAVLRLLGARANGPLPVAVLGDSDAVEIGETVLVVGSPYRLQGTVTRGIVSAVGRQIDVIQNELRIEDFIQTDAAVSQGNSGGALANARGEVIGLVTAIASETGLSEGYGFAVPTNLARRVAEDLIAFGEVRRGYLGVDALAVTPQAARAAGMSRITGVLVENVIARGPAAQAGVRPGDVLLAVAGRPVNELNQFQSRLAMRRPGEQIPLTVWRDGAERQFVATLVPQSDPIFQQWVASREAVPSEPAPETLAPAPRADAADWGIRFRDLTASERGSLRVAAGALVEAVRPESSADLDGLPVGTVVIEVEGRAVGSAEQARQALAALSRRSRPALLRVRRADGRTAFYDLAPPFEI